MSRPEGVRADYPLERRTTIRTGGPGDWFARPGTLDELLELLRWSDAEAIEVGVVGSGSNLLISDLGFRGLVLKLDQDLATIEHQGQRLVCGGGARLPQAAAPSPPAGRSRPGVGGKIPGTLGGAGEKKAKPPRGGP